MLKYRFLRGSFIFSVLFTVALSLHTIYFTLPSFSRLLTSNTEEEAVRVVNHLVTMMGEQGPHATENLLLTDLFKKRAERVLKDFSILKYRVFSTSGRIVFSTVEKEIGKQNSFPYFHNIVAQGKPYSKTVAKERNSLEGEAFKIDVVETYAPIMLNGHFYGAFEIYFDITRRKAAMDDAVFVSSTMLFAIGGGFLGLLFFIRRLVIRSISRVSGAMLHMADGNLEHQVPVVGNDELSDMAQIFNRMCEELKKSHRGLRLEKNKLTTILLGAREGIIATDSSGEVVLVNPAAELLLGKKQEQIIQGGFLNLFDDPDFLKAFLASDGRGMPEVLVYNQHALNIYASTIREEDGTLVGSAALIRDVTEEKQLEDKLRTLSHTDGLTGLFNRRRMDELLLVEFDRATRYGLVFWFMLFDVDHFKKFNDTHGHDQGDRVLQALGKVMKGYFRSADYCCRYGGEEFAIIMPSTVKPGILDAAERFRQEVESMRVDGLKVTISIGVAIYPNSGFETPQTLIKGADTALYEAKKAGRNCVRSVLG